MHVAKFELTLLLISSQLPAVHGSAVRTFLGQRFALPPTGNKRYAEAELAAFDEASISDEADIGFEAITGTFGPRCMQLSNPRHPRCDQGSFCNSHDCEAEQKCISEDCLFLNVYAPVSSLPVAAGGQGQEAPKPVLVFVHGGGFTIGSGNMFDGSVLASGQDIVVITINYRLDALGFFASEELAKESKHGALGSQNGALDVVTALRWVQANVHRFGGDPQQVTLGGWSAGAMMTCSLLASPVAAGLFHRAIIESGPCLGGATGWGSSPEDVVLSASAAFANGRNLSQMRAVEDGYELLQHDMTAGKIQSAPDGYLMPGHRSSWYDPSPPFAAFRNDRLNTKEIIIGATSFDGLGAFGVLGDYSTWTRMMPVAHYNRKMNTAWGSYKQGIEQIYPRSRFAGNTDAAFCKPDADSSVVCPSMEIAKAVSELGGKAYAYHFDYGPVCGELMTNEPFGLAPWGSPNWASHGAELAWVFGTKTSCFRKPAEVALTTTMQNMWGSFVRTGEPQSGDLKWDAFDDSRGNTMLFDLLPRMVDHLKTDDCAALLSVDPVLWPTVEGETILQI